MSSVVGNMALRSVQLLAVANAALITAKHMNFEKEPEKEPAQGLCKEPCKEPI